MQTQRVLRTPNPTANLALTFLALTFLAPVMPSPNFVLLPKVFPSDLLSLGQLLRNPLIPNVDTYTKGCAGVKDADLTSPAVEEPYSTIVSVDTRGRFEIGLTKFLGSKFNDRSTNLLSIEAEKLEYHALKNATDVFKRVTADRDARDWIDDMVLNKTPCYFVIGIQVLHNAEFKRAVLKKSGASAYATVPLEATTQIPLHLKGELSAERFGTSMAKVSGVFGVEVQKLRSKIDPTGKPSLTADATWHWSYQRVKGTQQEEDKELSIKLEDVELDELVNILKQDDEEDDDDDDEQDN